MSAAPIFPGSINASAVTVVNADSTNKKTVFTAGSSGARVEMIAATSDDTSDRTLQWWVTISGTDYLLGETLIEDGSGSNGTDKAKNILNATDFPWVRSEGGNPVLYLPASAILKCAAKVAVTAAKFIYVYASGVNY